MSKDSSARYYQKKQRKKSKKDLVKNIKIFPKKKRKKRQYGHEQSKIFTLNQKQKLVDYRKRYHEKLKYKIRFFLYYQKEKKTKSRTNYFHLKTLGFF